MRLVPGQLRSALGFDDAAAVASRKIEIGSGAYPTAGYIHVDIDPFARHAEVSANAWQLPFPDGWATEIVSIHALEHVPPSNLISTLREWHRVLGAGGAVRVHVPNSPELMERFVDSDVAGKWRVMGAVLGMYCGPQVMGPKGLCALPDHRILFDGDLLLWALREAGFADVTDVTESVVDRHVVAWRGVVRHFSLVAEGRKPLAS